MWKGKEEKKATKIGCQTLEGIDSKHSIKDHATCNYEEIVDKQPNHGTTEISIAEVVTQEWRDKYGEKNKEKGMGKY